jgi:hypothetical protein
MAVNHFTVTASQHWNLESVYSDRFHHPVNNVIVLARVARVEDQFVDGPDPDLPWGFSWDRITFSACFGLSGLL